MAETRFLCETNKYGITTTFAVVVMLLLFMASCGSEHKEVVKVEFEPETTYTMRTTDVSSLISDSGITRYRMVAKEWLVYGKAKDPYNYFPEGVYLEKFDSLFNVEMSVKADTAYYWDKKGLYKLAGNVKVINPNGEKFETSLLFINEKEDRVYSDKYIAIDQGESTVTGFGFESNLNMTKYEILSAQAEFPFKDKAPTDSTQVNIGDSVVVDVAKKDSIKKN